MILQEDIDLSLPPDEADAVQDTDAVEDTDAIEEVVSEPNSSLPVVQHAETAATISVTEDSTMQSQSLISPAQPAEVSEDQYSHQPKDTPVIDLSGISGVTVTINPLHNFEEKIIRVTTGPNNTVPTYNIGPHESIESVA